MNFKRILCFIALTGCILTTSSCSAFEAGISEMKGNISGNTYTIDTFDNFGVMTMQTHGSNINMEANVVEEMTYNSNDGWGKTKSLSSVVTINIDGHEMVTCGDTCIFYEDGLTPEVIFDPEESIQISSSSDGITDATIITGMVNKWKNSFGKSMVVVIKSQTGYPIYAFSGDDVNWTVSDNLPKTTRLLIDGKLLYIHRGNFQIIDKALLE